MRPEPSGPSQPDARPAIPTPHTPPGRWSDPSGDLPEWLLVAALGVVFLGFLAALRWAHPVADDLDFAAATRESGFIVAWKQQYLTWNGRFVSMALALASPPVVESLTAYRLALASIVLLTAGSLYWLVAVFSAGAWTRCEMLAVTLTLMLIYLSQMPGLDEGVFWYTSGVIYQVGVIALLLHLASVTTYIWTHRQPWLAASSILLFAAAGFNEVMMLLLVVSYAAMLAWAAVTRSPHRGLIGMHLAIALCGAAVVISSPGNAAREAMYPGRHQLVKSLAMTTFQEARFVGDWTTNGALLIASVLFMPLARRLARRLDLSAADRAWVRALSIIGALVVVPIVVFPTYWATGVLGGHRTVNTGFFVFLLLWLVALTTTLAATDVGAVLSSLDSRVRACLTILLVLALALTRNSYTVGADAISGRLSQFDVEMLKRERTLEHCQASAADSCMIDRLQTKPTSLFALDPSDDPGDWINVAYARYYGLRTVRASSDHVEPVTGALRALR